ncbi:hypothetical protein [Pseudoxanthomonas putridarboris]|uniref:Bacteriocin-type signal sequence-containing protein n=1 Tax=Pseudoxanthomonas putridarboris TaxID=752605 RepID=A0ABU9IXB0_9GAMM
MRELSMLEASEVSGGNKILVEVIKWIAGSLAWDALKGGEEQDSDKFIVDKPGPSSAVSG